MFSERMDTGMNSVVRGNKKVISGQVFDSINIMIMIVLCCITLFPFIHVLAVSLNEGTDAARGGIWFWPRSWTLDNFKKVLSDSSIVPAYLITITRTLLGTLLSVFFTAAFAYGITKRDLIGRNLYLTIGVITMFFSGGIIPTYLLMHWLHLTNTFWVYIFPTMFSFWNVLIFQGFFKEIPNELSESAQLDGANELLIFCKIIVPVSTPALACIALFCGVGHWNAWYDAYIYNNNALQTLQCLLMRLVKQNTTTTGNINLSEVLGQPNMTITMESVRSATIIVAVGPIIMIYPFLQKFFTKGLILGSVKG